MHFSRFLFAKSHVLIFSEPHTQIGALKKQSIWRYFGGILEVCLDLSNTSFSYHLLIFITTYQYPINDSDKYISLNTLSYYPI